MWTGNDYVRKIRHKPINIKPTKIKILDHNYKVGNKSILNNKAEYKYKTLYKVLFEITKTWINGTVTL